MLGRNHHDYQLMRAGRMHHVDEAEDSEVIDEPATATTTPAQTAQTAQSGQPAQPTATVSHGPNGATPPEATAIITP